MEILKKKRKPGYYDERIYIKDGKLQQLTESLVHIDGKALLTEVYVEYTKVTKKDIFAAIEDYLSRNSDKCNLNTIVMASIKLATGIPICLHCKTPKKPNSKIMVDDPLYQELVTFIQNLESYKETKKIAEEKRIIQKKRVDEAREAIAKEKMVDNFVADAQKREVKRKRR